MIRHFNPKRSFFWTFYRSSRMREICQRLVCDLVSNKSATRQRSVLIYLTTVPVVRMHAMCHRLLNACLIIGASEVFKNGLETIVLTTICHITIHSFQRGLFRIILSCGCILCQWCRVYIFMMDQTFLAAFSYCAVPINDAVNIRHLDTSQTKTEQQLMPPTFQIFGNLSLAVLSSPQNWRPVYFFRFVSQSPVEQLLHSAHITRYRKNGTGRHATEPATKILDLGGLFFLQIVSTEKGFIFRQYTSKSCQS